MCNCVKEINNNLKEYSYSSRIHAVPFDSDSGTINIAAVHVVTEKTNVLPLTILAKFCPFCGEAYPSHSENINIPAYNIIDTMLPSRINTLKV